MGDIVKISDAVAIGIHAATLLAAFVDKAYSTRSMASRLDVSEAHLAKVMQRLSRAGIVLSMRGPSGGFVLARPARDITFLEVFEAIDGPLSIPGCLIGQPRCNGSACVMGGLLNQLHEKILAYFQETTLADLASVLKC